jgi:hypothetical protein
MEGETVATVEATPQNLEEPSEEQSNPNPGGSTDQRSVEEKLADPTISKTQQKKLLRKQAYVQYTCAHKIINPIHCRGSLNSFNS